MNVLLGKRAAAAGSDLESFSLSPLSGVRGLVSSLSLNDFPRQGWEAGRVGGRWVLLVLKCKCI